MRRASPGTTWGHRSDEPAAVKLSRQDSKGGRCAEESLSRTLVCLGQEEATLAAGTTEHLRCPPMQLWEQVPTCPPGHSGIPPLPGSKAPAGEGDRSRRASVTRQLSCHPRRSIPKSGEPDCGGPEN